MENRTDIYKDMAESLEVIAGEDGVVDAGTRSDMLASMRDSLDAIAGGGGGGGGASGSLLVTYTYDEVHAKITDASHTALEVADAVSEGKAVMAVLYVNDMVQIGMQLARLGVEEGGATVEFQVVTINDDSDNIMVDMVQHTTQSGQPDQIVFTEIVKPLG